MARKYSKGGMNTVDRAKMGDDMASMRSQIEEATYGDPLQEYNPESPVAVDLSEAPMAYTDPVDGATIRQDGGSIIVDFAPSESGALTLPPGEHEDNLAVGMEENDLNQMAEKIIEYVEADIESRNDWVKRYESGIKNLGLIEENYKKGDEPFEGASTVVYPLLSVSVVQFQARAIAEVFPPEGPVRATVVGKDSEEKREQCERVKEYMNYQILERDTSFFEELDQLLFYLPIGGSAFKKVYYDEAVNSPVSKFVRPEYLIVPYIATTLEDAPRYTHHIKMTQNEMRKHQHGGFYRKVELMRPTSEDSAVDAGKRTVTSVDDKVESKKPIMAEFDYRHDVYESHIDWDLKGYEHKDESGEPTGIELPYIITVDKLSRKILSIRRNWKKDDISCTKRIWFIHYKYLPGTGFYGFGLMHLIGGLAKATTGAVRAILDAAARATLTGGFKAKGGNLKGGKIELTPGKWIDVDLTADELAKAFYTPPVKEPSPALFNLFKELAEAGDRATSTTEAMVGDANNNGPVGTTLALIEQGSKVYSAIHKRLHQAAGKEYRLRAALNFEFLPLEEDYPYDVQGGERTIKGKDFDGRVDIVPVSDPNIFSASQRIAQAQGVFQMYQQDPSVYRPQKVHKMVLGAMKVPDIDELLIDPNKRERLDPVTENMAILMQKPVCAFSDQDHMAHIAVHKAFLQNPQYGGHPEAQKVIMQPMIAHISEHLAYYYRQQAMQMAGVPIPDANLHAAHGDDILDQPLDPMVENQISALMAQHAQELAGMPGLPPDPDPNAEAAQLDIEAKKQDMALDGQKKQQDLTHSQERHQLDMAQKGESFVTDEMMKAEEFKNQQARDNEKAKAQADAAKAKTSKTPKKESKDE